MIKYSLHASMAASEMASFSFLPRTTDRRDCPESARMIAPQREYACGQWVNVEYKSANFHGLVLDVKENQYQIRCLKLSVSGKAFMCEPENQRGTPFGTTGTK